MPVAPSLNRGQVRALVGLVGTALRASPWVVAGFVVFQLASVFTSLAQPALNAAIIDDGILRGDVGTIKVVGLLMVAVAVVNLAVSLGATYLASHLSASSARDLRGRVNGRIGMFTDQQVARLGLSSLLTRSTGDVAQIQGFLFIFLTVVVTAPLMLFGALFGIWASTLIGVSIQDVKVKKYEDEIRKGCLLMLVDIPDARESEVIPLIKSHHPEAKIEKVTLEEQREASKVGV